jgi:hypothetical protein
VAFGESLDDGPKAGVVLRQVSENRGILKLVVHGHNPAIASAECRVDRAAQLATIELADVTTSLLLDHFVTSEKETRWIPTAMTAG